LFIRISYAGGQALLISLHVSPIIRYIHSAFWQFVDESFHRPIDRLDLRLLDILQRHGALSVAEVASRVRLSTTTCWRRIQQLEQDGVIKARVALLDRNALGLDVTIFAHVKLATTGRDALAEFEAAIRERAEVLECYTLTGEWDFLLKIVTKNVKAYEAFYLDYLSRIPCVRSINSSVAVTVIKESTALPLGIADGAPVPGAARPGRSAV
jgi:Lrp/AsnC family transcriptional regulator